MTWYKANNANDSQGLVIEEETGRNVAVTYDPKDAALVAAAPELLEVLKMIMIQLPDWAITTWAYDKAWDTIRKAEGE